MKYHEFRAMNTTILLGADGDPEQVNEGFQQAEEQVHRHEQRFTRFSNTSELAALNRSAGDWFQASPEFYEVVHLAYDAFRETGGLFDPGILSALEWAGYDRSMDEVRSRVNTMAPTAYRFHRSSPDFSQVLFDPTQHAISLPEGLRIDLGGIAKGWIAEQAAYRLNRFSNACVVDAGGDIFAIGKPGDADKWTIALEDPFDPNHDLAILSVGQGGVATSTVTKRRWQQDGQERHHLIDPRTGLSAQVFWVSVTVIADRTTRAETLAKSLLIAGPEGAHDLIANHPDVIFIAVDEGKKIWGSERSQEVLYGYEQKA
jgi:thiamine biosynthesis lipoprotein